MTNKTKLVLYGLGSLLVAFSLQTPVLAKGRSSGGGGGKDNVRAGIYFSNGYGGQSTQNGWGFDMNIGLGVRVYSVGFGAEAHYIYDLNSSYIPLSSAIYLGRFELFPFGNFKIAALGGRSISVASSQTVAGVRVAYEGHAGPYFSMEPSFTVLQTLGSQATQSYLVGVTFGLWNEAFLATVLYSLVKGAVGRRGHH